MRNRAIFAIVLIVATVAGCGPASTAVPGALPLQRMGRAAQAGPILWLLPEMVRAGPTSPPAQATTVALAAARNQTVAFQAVVSAPPSQKLENVRVALGPFTASLAASSAIGTEVYREWFVRVTEASPVYGHPKSLGAGIYPDGLIPFVDDATGKPPKRAPLRAQPIAIAAGTSQPYWIDIDVPAGTAPGDYATTLRVTSDEGAAEKRIGLHVWHVTMPPAPSVDSDFEFQSSSDEHQLVSQQELLRHRVQPNPVNADAEPVLIARYGLKMAGLGFWGGAYYGHCVLAQPPPAGLVERSVKHQTVRYIYDQPADEIGSCKNLDAVLVPIIRHWARNLHAAGVLDMITMAPIPALETDGTPDGRSAVDIWTMLPVEYDASVAQVRKVLAKGDRAWWYTALSQDDYSPKWEVDVPPADYRIEALVDQNLDLTGEVYWAVDAWSYVRGGDPWYDIESNQGGTLYAGEGILMYPGKDVGTLGDVPSMRLKWIRDGMYDADAVALLDDCGLGGWASQKTRTIAADFHRWTDDPAKIAAVAWDLEAKLDAECPN